MATDDHKFKSAIRRGFLGRCPNCGRGRLFSGYLRTVQNCAVCNVRLGGYQTADGPAFATITIVGLLLIPTLGWSYVRFQPEPIHLAMTVCAVLTVVTLILLRIFKGMFVGYLWATDEKNEGT